MGEESVIRDSAICCSCRSEDNHLSLDELEAAAASKESEKRKSRPLCRECFLTGLKPVLWGVTQKNRLPGQRKRASEVKAPANTKKPKGLKAAPRPTPAPPKASASAAMDALDL